MASRPNLADIPSTADGSSRLQKTLLDAGVVIAFFNQHADAGTRPDYGDRQLAACHGQWDSYDLD